MEDFILCQTHAPSNVSHLPLGENSLPDASRSCSLPTAPHLGSAPDIQVPGKCQILHPRDAVGWTQQRRVGGSSASSPVGTTRQTSLLQEGEGIDPAVWSPNS